MSTMPWHVDWAGSGDVVGIRHLLAEPLPGAVRLAVAARDPLAAESRALVVRAGDGQVLGYGARTVRLCWSGGVPRPLGYLHGLRRAACCAGQGRLLARMLGHLWDDRRSGEEAWDLTSIVANNDRALRVLSRLPEAPRYHPVGDYRTVVVSARVAARWSDDDALSLTPESIDAAAALVSAQAQDGAVVAHPEVGSPAWLSLSIGGRLRGVVRICDQPEVGTWQVAGYAPWLARVRPLVNVALRLGSRPTLPRPGAELRLIAMAHLAVAEGGMATVRALFAAAARRHPDALLVWGLGARHPLRPYLDRLPSWCIDSHLFAVARGDAPSPRSFSPEVAWL